MLVNGFVNVSISTLERRFGLLSSETGVISVGYDIAFCVCTMFVTYYGARMHRPRLLAIGSSIMGLGALVFSIPHFTTGLYEYANDFSGKRKTLTFFTLSNSSPSYVENFSSLIYEVGTFKQVA